MGTRLENLFFDIILFGIKGLTVTPLAYFDCCAAECDVLRSSLSVVGVYAPLGWSGLPNRKAFRKFMRVNRGDRIHTNSSENDELPDGVRALRLFCKTRLERHWLLKNIQVEWIYLQYISTGRCRHVIHGYFIQTKTYKFGDLKNMKQTQDPITRSVQLL